MNEKEIINEHDMTKKMLSSINEFKNAPQLDGGEEKVSNDKTYELTGTDLADAEELFRENVGKASVEFNEFYILPDTKNAEWSGTFTNNDLEWAFNLTEDEGIYITTNQTQLTDAVVEIIRLLKAHYITWTDTWEDNMTKASYLNNAG